MQIILEIDLIYLCVVAGPQSIALRYSANNQVVAYHDTCNDL